MTQEYHNEKNGSFILLDKIPGFVSAEKIKYGKITIYNKGNVQMLTSSPEDFWISPIETIKEPVVMDSLLGYRVSIIVQGYEKEELPTLYPAVSTRGFTLGEHILYDVKRDIYLKLNEKDVNRCTLMSCIPDTVNEDRIVTGKIFFTSEIRMSRYYELPSDKREYCDNFYINNRLFHYKPHYTEYPYYETEEVVINSDVEIYLDKEIKIEFPKLFRLDSTGVKNKFYFYDWFLDIYYELESIPYHGEIDVCSYSDSPSYERLSYCPVVKGKIHYKSRAMLCSTGDEHEEEIHKHDLFYSNKHIANYSNPIYKKYRYKGEYKAFIALVDITLEKGYNDIKFPKIMKVSNKKLIWIYHPKHHRYYKLKAIPWTLL